MDNVLCNVIGRKRVTLWAPDQEPFLYIHESTSAVTNIDEPDLAQFPAFAHARSTTVVLEPGDMLFLPCLCPYG